MKGRKWQGRKSWRLRVWFFRKASTVDWLDLHGGAVTEDLGDALHDFGGVVTDADDRVGALGIGVGNHVAKGLVAGLLAEFGVNGDVAAEQTLEAGADV